MTDSKKQSTFKRFKTVNKRKIIRIALRSYKRVNAFITHHHLLDTLKFFAIGSAIGVYLQVSSMIYVGLVNKNMLLANPYTIIQAVIIQLSSKSAGISFNKLFLTIAFVFPALWFSICALIFRLRHFHGLKLFLTYNFYFLIWTSLSDTVIQYLINKVITLGNPLLYLSYWLMFYTQKEIIKNLLLSGLIGFLPLLFIIASSKKVKKIPNIHGNAHFATYKEIQKKKLFGKEGIYLGEAYYRDLFLPGYEHVIMYAPSGSGKTTGNAIINLLTWLGSCIPLDLKLTLFKKTSGYRKAVGQSIYLWAPGSLFSHCYNALDFISSDPIKRIDEIQRIAHIFIPDNPKVSDPFWYQNARLILIALIHYVIDAKEHRKTFGEINLIVKSACNFTEFVKKATERDDIHYICRNNFLRFLNTNHKTHKNIIDTLLTYLAIFDNPLVEAATAKSDFDIRKLRQEKMTIYIGINPADLERLAPLISIFYEQVVDAMLRTVPKKDEPFDVMLQIDEFAALRRMESFTKIGIFREYRMRALLYIQDISQLYSKYGRDDAKIFLNAKARIAYTQIDLETANLLQASIGNDTIEVTTHSKRLPPLWLSHAEMGVSTTYVARPLMLAQEILTMPENKMLILIEGCNAIYADKIFWHKKKKFRKKILKPIPIPSIRELANELYQRAVEMSDQDRKLANNLEDLNVKVTDTYGQDIEPNTRSNHTMINNIDCELDKNI